MQSYTSNKMGLGKRISEFRNLFKLHSHDVSRIVRRMIERIHRTEAAIQRHTGATVENMRILEIGPGQKQPQMLYFGRKNQVVGIDIDYVANGWNPIGYVKMLKSNGFTRTCKTVARKMLRLDARYHKEMKRQLGGMKPLQNILQMDAADLKFEAGSFDAVYTSAVFEHLPEPGKVLEEVKRVLKPGGIVFIDLHLFTSDSGCHDARIFAHRREMLPKWSHLRPKYQDRVQTNAYLNKIRINQWREIFEKHLPGCALEAWPDETPGLLDEIKQIKSGGELTEYADEELQTLTFVAVWKKPAEGAARETTAVTTAA
ncbi:MAG: class I SAM-dependent methyltransferase [Phycisphaerae bacterium]